MEVQGKIDIKLPTTFIEAQVLIGMVQYYIDMWPRRSRIFAPLIEAASSPRGRKTFEMMHMNNPL